MTILVCVIKVMLTIWQTEKRIFVALPQNEICRSFVGSWRSPRSQSIFLISKFTSLGWLHPLTSVVAWNRDSSPSSERTKMITLVYSVFKCCANVFGARTLGFNNAFYFLPCAPPHLRRHECHHLWHPNENTTSGNEWDSLYGQTCFNQIVTSWIFQAGNMIPAVIICCSGHFAAHMWFSIFYFCECETILCRDNCLGFFGETKIAVVWFCLTADDT